MVISAETEVEWHSHNENSVSVVTMVASVIAVQHSINDNVGVSEMMEIKAAVAKATV